MIWMQWLICILLAAVSGGNFIPYPGGPAVTLPAVNGSAFPRYLAPFIVINNNCSGK